MFQQWKYTKASATIGNQQAVGNLYVDGNDPTTGKPVLLGPNSQTPGSQWYAWPTYPLDAILAEQPPPFPQFTGDELTAYDYIKQNLGLSGNCTLAGQAYSGVRCKYINLAAPLSAYQTQIATMTPDPSVSATT